MASQNQHISACLVNDHGIWTVKARFADAPGAKSRLHSKSTKLKVNGHNKRKAEATMRDIVNTWESQIASGQTHTSNMQFHDCVRDWLQIKALTLRPNTLESYTVLAENQIIPKLGNIPINGLTRQDIQFYFDSLKGDVSPNTMPKHRVVIHGALDEACLNGYLDINVSDKVRLPKIVHYEGKTLDESEIRQLLQAADGQTEPVRSVITLALAYGLRRSEICGLRWCDVDFRNNLLHIRHTRTELSGTVYESDTTKTKASRRDLPLVESTISYLQELQKQQKQSGAYTGYVCSHPDGREVKPEYVTRVTGRFLRQCGFEGMRLHDLRHTAASILAKLVPLKQVQAFLGHEDAHTTIQIYTHVRDDDRVETSKAMSSFLESCSETCSETAAVTENSVIDIAQYQAKKFAEA